MKSDRTTEMQMADVVGETNSRVLEYAEDTASESPPVVFILGILWCR